MTALERVLSRLPNARQRGKQWLGLCPAHEDTKPSLSIAAKDGKVLLHCHAGCSVEAIVAALGLRMADLFAPLKAGLFEDKRQPGKPQSREIVATYDYTDEAGRLLFQVVRFRPKGFSQRRPDGQGGWTWDVKGVRRVLYRLPKVLEAAARGQRVYVVEGEKATDALESLGLTATCNPGGAGKWRKDYSGALRGAHVVILPDNDAPGRKHGDQVARSTHDLAAGVRVAALPGLPDKGDVSDWLSGGHTREELEALVERTPEWRPEAAVPERFPLTDLGNAERLIAAHGANLRYHVHRGVWLHWTGKVWAEDETGEAQRLAAQVVRAMARQADVMEGQEEREALYKHVLRSEAAARLAAMVELARWRPGIPVVTSELDRDPWLLNALNGTLDLRTGELRPHDPKGLITKLAPVVYDAEAKAPRWELFLGEVLQGDDKLVHFIQRLAGYALTGDTREQAAFFLVGKGANGKTVLTETLRAMLGDYAKDTPFSTFLERRDTNTADLASLVGARLVTASEAGPGQVFNEALLKRVTGGDVLTCRYLYREHFSYSPTFKVLLATNEVPRFASQTRAVKRRVRIIPFRQTFYALDEGREPVRDEHLREKLLGELPGILAWAVRGCLEWQREGLRPPSVVLEETAALFEAMDPLGDFLEEECVLHPRVLVESGALWRAYRGWCDQEQRPLAFKTPAWFTRSLAQRDGVEMVRRHDGRYLTGIGLRAEEGERNVGEASACRYVSS